MRHCTRRGFLRQSVVSHDGLRYAVGCIRLLVVPGFVGKQLGEAYQTPVGVVSLVLVEPFIHSVGEKRTVQQQLKRALYGLFISTRLVELLHAPDYLVIVDKHIADIELEVAVVECDGDVAYLFKEQTQTAHVHVAVVACRHLVFVAPDSLVDKVHRHSVFVLLVDKQQKQEQFLCARGECSGYVFAIAVGDIEVAEQRYGHPRTVVVGGNVGLCCQPDRASSS